MYYIELRSGLEYRDYGSRGSVTLTTRHTSIHKKLALTSQTPDGRSVGILLSRTREMEFSLVYSVAIEYLFQQLRCFIVL
jgi:hypothetical protein